MPTLIEDSWINRQVASHPISELEDCAIAVDATYYLQLFLDTPPYHEPLLPALGGLTGLHKHIEDDLDQWKAHRITPLFVFDGQPITGQDEINVIRGRRANEKTDYAWDIYFGGQAEDAVLAFGANGGAFRTQNLYPLLQGILKKRQIHFLVPPYNASAQVAYFDMIDSDQCGGIMGPQELLLYPVKDSIIRTINWEKGTVEAISKNHIVKALNVTPSMFMDGLLMCGTSFLPTFPPLLDSNLIKQQPYNVSDAVNVLRTTEKSITATCNAFHDVLQKQEPNWLDKYRKARMAVEHFIYIAENGEVQVHDFDKLTKDNHEYLGLQLPSELFHYLNTGMIGPRTLGYITHGQLIVPPTVDGFASEEYKKLITSQLVPVREHTLALLVPRLNRGIQYKTITMRVWFDSSFNYTINHRGLQQASINTASSWDVKAAAIKQRFPKFSHGSIISEVLALKNSEFVKSTMAGDQKTKGIGSADIIVSSIIFRTLNLRGYVDNSHNLTAWGLALARALSNLESTVEDNPTVPYLYDSLLVAFEMLRFDLLNAKNQHVELQGLPMNGSESDKESLLLISRCATLLRLRHEANGYTGPLSKNLLAFHSLATEVRAAERDLTEAIMANMFMYGQAKRERDDGWELSHRLPFMNNPDVALGIAVKTYLDEVSASDTTEERASRRASFPGKYMPYALDFAGDLRIACAFFDAIHAGVKGLSDTEMSAADRLVWQRASEYLKLRR